MTRILVHAGFHKTGTTSLQTYLAQNRHALAPYLDYYGQSAFPQAANAARTYGQKPFFWRRRAFRHALKRFLHGLPERDTFVLSCESFSGHMPGHRDWRKRTLLGYRKTAVPLCREIAAALHQRFGRDADIAFLFTTRERKSWIGSLYGHLVRSIPLCESPESFRAGLPDNLSPRSEAEDIAKALHPFSVHLAPLERHGDRPEGPAAAVLDLLGVPSELRKQLPPAAQQNRRQDRTVEAAFLDLNRSNLPRAELRSRKGQLLQDAVS